MVKILVIGGAIGSHTYVGFWKQVMNLLYLIIH